MSKELKLSQFGAIKRLSLFLKLRKGKTISEQTVNDFESLTHGMMFANFKNCDDFVISLWEKLDNECIALALKAIRSQFIQWEGGGNCRLSDIDSFGLYQDDKCRATIKGNLREITRRDHNVLKYVVFGQR